MSSHNWPAQPGYVLVKGNTSPYTNGTTNNVFQVTAVPKGTYIVTIGMEYVYQTGDQEAYIEPRLNTAVINAVGGTWKVGKGDDAGAVFQGYTRGLSSVRLVDFPNSVNTFELTIVSSGVNGIIQSPQYMLQKLTDYVAIGTEWD